MNIHSLIGRVDMNTGSGEGCRSPIVESPSRRVQDLLPSLTLSPSFSQASPEAVLGLDLSCPGGGGTGKTENAGLAVDGMPGPQGWICASGSPR